MRLATLDKQEPTYSGSYKLSNMKRFLVILVFLTHASGMTAQQADIIIVHANVKTLDETNPQAEAVAIAGNKIIFVGTSEQALTLKGKRTNIIDAKGNTVIPGLFDSHLHIIRAGRFYNSELRWDGVDSKKRALEMLKEQALRTPEGQWVRVVGGWNEQQFVEKRLPTLEEINNATGNVPAFILYLYGKAWLNKAGLKKLNIDSSTPNPPGGLIEKNSDGNPTGMLVAEPNAFILYATLARLPELTVPEKMNSTLQFIRELNRLGVTAAMDAGGGFQHFPQDYGITDSLCRMGKLTIRLPYFLFAQKKGSEVSDFTSWTSLVNIDEHGAGRADSIDYYVEGAGENLVADAADFENFLFPRPELPERMETNLKAVIKLLVKKRWPFRIHATYNESITRDLNVIEEVNREIPLNGLTWFFDHAETISDENMMRIKALGGGIAIQHRMAYQGELFIRRYGKAAAMAAPPVKKMLQLGMPVALGTDGTRVASYNPWIALYWITTGKTVGGTRVMAAKNVIDRLTALQLFTTGGYALIKEPLKGRIKKGFFADLVVLNQNYFSVPDEKIKSIAAKLTIVDGRIVYGDSDFKAIAPPVLPFIPSWSPVKYYGAFQH